jgi:hypothetical protein
MKLNFLIFAACSALVACAAAQGQKSAYVGQENREIKALPQAEVEGLLAGKGLGFAKSAELNGYPGPAHVLELSEKLVLSPEQVVQIKALFSRMEASAKMHGAELVQAERELEALFRSGLIEPSTLELAVDKVALHQAKVRNAHLVAHIEQKALLTSHQVAQYVALRGYGGAHSHSGHQ